MSSKGTKKTSTKKTTKKATGPKGSSPAVRSGAKRLARSEGAAAGTNRGHASGESPPALKLPPVGTVIQKKDRYGIVRCECTVEDGGIRYGGTLYRSLSAAAMAAAKDLGLHNKTQNGWTFWGLTKPPRPSNDPVENLERGWARYQAALAALKDGVTEDNRAALRTALRTHAQQFEAARTQVA